MTLTSIFVLYICIYFWFNLIFFFVFLSFSSSHTVVRNFWISNLWNWFEKFIKSIVNGTEIWQKDKKDSLEIQEKKTLNIKHESLSFMLQTSLWVYFLSFIHPYSIVLKKLRQKVRHEKKDDFTWIPDITAMSHFGLFTIQHFQSNFSYICNETHWKFWISKNLQKIIPENECGFENFPIY